MRSRSNARSRKSLHPRRPNPHARSYAPMSWLARTTAALLVCAASGLAAVSSADTPEEVKRSRIEEVIVTGERTSNVFSGASPRSYISEVDVQSIHVTSTEDIVSYEPSLIIRKRFIGDENGTLGIRGSNMFQTTRSMVFADGLPLHYLLQTRFSGAPRWSLVAPAEVKGVEVLYGPYSAEYGGNAMGGVVNIETELPVERRFHIEGSGFTQDFDLLGTDERFGGRRLQTSYGDRIGNLSVYLSHNHLTNEGHPQTFRFAEFTPTTAPDTVSGARGDSDAQGQEVVYFGDTGREKVTTNLTKLKLGYTLEEWVARATVAFEKRTRDSEDATSYLTDLATGQPFTNGTAVAGGRQFRVDPRSFEISFTERETLLVGLGLDGPITQDWNLELDFSVFDIVDDETRRSSGRVSRFEDTGWVTGSAKLRTDQFAGRADMKLATGVSYERYELEFQDFDSDDFRAGLRSSPRDFSGGETSVQAAFAQWAWQITERWDVQAGLRYERWQATDGFFGELQTDTRNENGLSPKFSLGFAPNDEWQIRYSIARAVRFPIVEELFQNERRFNSIRQSSPGLAPEEGLFQNLSIERALSNGFIRLNLFRESIDDVIFNQSSNILDPVAGVSTQLSTFLPIDHEIVNGVEVVGTLRGLMRGKLDVRSNITYTDAKIDENDANPELEGNRFPRLPKWRGNLVLTYHWNDKLDTSIGMRFASDSFGELDNSDRADGVFGAHDAYQFYNVKASYQLTETSRVAFGIDNLTDEEAYVFHPWPRRSAYVEFALDL